LGRTKMSRRELASVEVLAFRRECGATHAPLRVNDCQFAHGFESKCSAPMRRGGFQFSNPRVVTRRAKANHGKRSERMQAA
jgi:hypothetical protein